MILKKFGKFGLSSPGNTGVAMAIKRTMLGSGYYWRGKSNITIGTGGTQHQIRTLLSSEDTTEFYDTDGYRKDGSVIIPNRSRIYAPVSGYYQVDFSTSWVVNDANNGGYRSLGIIEWVNGVETWQNLCTTHAVLGAATTQTFSKIIQLEKDKWTGVFATQTSGVDQTLLGTQTCIGVHFIGTK